VKSGLIQSLRNTASTICQGRLVRFNKISNLRCDLQFNGYPQVFNDSVINFKGSSHPNKEQKPVSSVYIPCVKGVSGNLKRIGNRYNIKAIFKIKYSHRNLLIKTRPKRDPQHKVQCVPVNVAEATLVKQADL
jgi:hypothetical protein